MPPYRSNVPLIEGTVITWSHCLRSSNRGWTLHIFCQIHACKFRQISLYLHRVNTIFTPRNSRQYLKEMFLYLSGISMYRNNLIKWEHKTHKHLPAKNVTLPWCLVLVPPGCWNVIICTNRKQTGLQVSGCCLFSLSQAQQHREPDIRLPDPAPFPSTA